MTESTLAETLGQFGLSDKEIDTYLTLLEHGEAKASQIADDAGVSKRYAYSVSERLAERGFVEVNDHVVPTTIRPKPPEDVIDILQSDVESMRPGLEERFAETQSDTEQFEVIKSQVTVLKRIKTLIDEAESELTLSIPADHLEEVRTELAAAIDRGVLALLIVTDTDSAPDVADVASATRVWRESMPTMLTVDSRVGVVAPNEILARSNSDRQAIVFAQEQLSPVIVGSFFGNYWPVAEEVAVTEPAELPAEFSNFRHATFQATLHLRSGTDLRATVEGRAMAEDATVERTGRVVDVRQGMVKPANNQFPVQHSIRLETDEGTLTVGGPGAFVEDVEAEEVLLESV